LKSNEKVIIAGIAIVVILAIIAIIGAACCACVLCLTTSSTWHWGEWGGYAAQTEHSTNTTVFSGAANIELYVDTINGDIAIQESAAATDVTVTYDVFYPQGHMNDVQTDTRSDIINNDTVRITAEAKHNTGFISTGNYGAHITVMVPKNSSYILHLSTLNGDVNVAPLHGSSVIMDSKNGDVNLNGGRYDTIHMETYNGNVEAMGSYETNNVTLINRNGRIEVDTLQTAGTLNADTWNGHIQVTLPRDTLFRVDASTWNGQITHSSIPVTATTDKRTQLIGYTTGGAGNLTLTLTTRNGEIDINY
jgi:DUF4097 and DUF4098 domain-containing protein YvlB